METAELNADREQMKVGVTGLGEAENWGEVGGGTKEHGKTQVTRAHGTLYTL